MGLFSGLKKIVSTAVDPLGVVSDDSYFSQFKNPKLGKQAALANTLRQLVPEPTSAYAGGGAAPAPYTPPPIQHRPPPAQLPVQTGPQNQWQSGTAQLPAAQPYQRQLTPMQIPGMMNQVHP